VNPERSIRTGLRALGIAALIALAACGAPDDTAAPEGAAPTAAPSATTAADAQRPMRRIDFTLPDLDGTPQSLSQWDGDLVLLNFWATWCPPCKKEMPLFQAHYEEHAESGFTIVAVAVDELDETRAFVETFGIAFPILIGQEEAMAIGRDYGNRIGALPYTVVIDRTGMIRETHRGEVTESDLENWLQRYL
jgi:peroxiredoxin